MSIRKSFGVVFSVSAGLFAVVLTGCSSNTSSVPAADTTTVDAPAADATPARSATAPSAAAPKVTTQKGIAWQPSYQAARSQASTVKKPLMIDFYADWCQPCKMMDSQTFPDPSVVQAASQFTSVKVDTDKQNDLAQKYKVIGLPTTMWLNNKGEVIHKIEGFYPPADFVKEMETAQSKFSPLS